MHLHSAFANFKISAQTGANMKNHALEASVPWSKVAILGMVIPPFNRNPYNGYINPHYWVDGHPLLYRNNGSLDPGTSVFLPSSDKKIWSHLTHLNPSSRRLIFRLVQQQLQRLGLIKDFLGCLPPPLIVKTVSPMLIPNRWRVVFTQHVPKTWPAKHVSQTVKLNKLSRISSILMAG